MAYPFTTVVIHHQGAGTPNNAYQFAGGGYSYGVGVGSWRNFRDPSTDFSTADYNHVVVGVCLSGNRNESPVTQMDLQQLREISLNAKHNGWLVQEPEVRPHREMGGGNNTICPGNNAAPPWGPYPGNRVIWDQIVGCFTGQAVPVPEDDVPADKDFVDALTTSEGSWKLQYDGGVQTVSGAFYGSYFSLPPNVRNDPTRRFSSIFPNFNAPGYALMSTKGEVYNFKTKS
jgi:hypothetical protein